MMRVVLPWVSLVSLLLLPRLAAVELVNPGFETGDFTGWTQGAWNANDQSYVVTEWAGQTIRYTAPYGNYFAVAHGYINSNVYQTLDLEAGQTWSGMVAFELEADFVSASSGWVSVRDNGSGTWTTVLDVQTSEFTSGWMSLPWQPWSYTAPQAGSYSLMFVAYGNVTNSFANTLFDMPVVPEPGMLGLLLAGAPGMAWLRRRRRG